MKKLFRKSSGYCFFMVTLRSHAHYPQDNHVGRTRNHSEISSSSACSFRTQPSRIFQMTFGLWELANHRDFQEKLRAEINETLAKVKARGDTDFTVDDFERMPCLVAFVKVRWGHLFVSRNEDKIPPTGCTGSFEGSPPHRRSSACACAR